MSLGNPSRYAAHDFFPFDSLHFSGARGDNTNDSNSLNDADVVHGPIVAGVVSAIVDAKPGIRSAGRRRGFEDQGYQKHLLPA